MAYFLWRYPGEELGVSNYAYHTDGIHDDLYSIFAERYATCVRFEDGDWLGKGWG